MSRNIVSVALAATVLCGCGGGGGSPSDPVVQVSAPGSVRGTVKDDAGLAVAAVPIQLSATGKTTLTASTGIDGVFTITNVAVGVWQVTAIPPTGFSGESGPTVTVSANQQASVNVVLTKLQTGEAPLNADVTMLDISFNPASVTIKQSGSVRWTNNDGVAHTTTGAAFDSGVLQKGATFTQQFPTKGTFPYRCTLHPGMSGSVTVQ